MQTTTIGTVTLTDDQTFTRQYETAAWFQDIHVPAGATAELRLDARGFVYATFAGVKGRSNFTSLYGGVPITRDGSKIDRGMGEPDTYGFQTYAYMAAKAIHEGTFLGGAEVTLADGVSIESTMTDRTYADGRPVELFGFRIEEVAV